MLLSCEILLQSFLLCLVIIDFLPQWASQVRFYFSCNEGKWCFIPEACNFLTVREIKSISKFLKQKLGAGNLNWPGLEFCLLIKGINYFLTVKLEKSSLQRMQKMGLLNSWYAFLLVTVCWHGSLYGSSMPYDCALKSAAILTSLLIRGSSLQ